MSWTHLSSRTSKARISHQCTWCGEIIQQGDTYNREVGVSECVFNCNKYHPECYTAMVASDFDDDLGFEPFRNIRGWSIF